MTSKKEWLPTCEFMSAEVFPLIVYSLPQHRHLGCRGVTCHWGNSFLAAIFSPLCSYTFFNEHNKPLATVSVVKYLMYG